MNPRHFDVLRQAAVAVVVFSLFIGAAVLCFGCASATCASAPTPPEGPLTCYTSAGAFQSTPTNEWGTTITVTQNDPAWPCRCTVNVITEQNNGLSVVHDDFTGSCQ